MNQYRYDINMATIEAPRTQFRIPHNYKTTFNAGELIPVCCEEILPGDSWSKDLSGVCRELTLLNPVMDNSYIQFDAFFVPWRIIWNHTKQFFGENDTGIWTQTHEYEIPSGALDLHGSHNQISSGSLGDYFGLPVGVAEDAGQETFNYLPLRAYAEIWNYYYMAETTQAMELFSKDDNIEFGINLSKGYNSQPLKVNRFPDLFTCALPQPQKGENVPFLSNFIPVVPVSASHLTAGTPTFSEATFGDNLTWGKPDGSSSLTSTGTIGLNAGKTNVVSGTNSSTTYAVPNNLYASTANTALRDINSLRIAIATQHLFEALARGGSRYGEYLSNIFGVNSPSEIINIPQYLGSIKKLINVNQVLATADTDGSILGQTGAFSNTGFANEHLFTQSFTEHGYILILAHVRTDNSYSQGVPKMFSKKTKFDIYMPPFANIGNVAIKNKEIYFSDDFDKDNEVFGFVEAWYEYKNKPNLLTGYMRPGLDQSFNTWTYGRVFSDTPVLNSVFTTQTSDEVDRTIAVQSSLSNQFKLDLFFDNKVSRIMPLYSTPGLKRI